MSTSISRTTAQRRPLRVLMLSTVFPRPTNMLFGPWAKGMAEALLAYGVSTEVVSFTSWVPRWMVGLPKARSWATCPPEMTWGPLHVTYPRWLFYEIGPMRKQARKAPRMQNHLGWLHAKGRLKRQIERQRPDVVFAVGTVPSGYLAFQIHRKLGVPYVVSDVDFGEFEDCNLYPRRKRVYREIAEGASTMVAVSRRMEDVIKQLSPRVNAVTVFNGIAPIPEQFWKTPRPPEIVNKKVIFCAATFYERKDVPSLIRAFAKVAAKHPDAVLRLAGDGRERAKVDEAIAECNLSSRVQRLGILPREGIFQEMIWCDFFALTGWDEPFATVYLEAMAAGKPIVCCNDGGINDILKNNEHGYTVPPRDIDATAAALDRMLGNDAERARLGRNAKQLFETTLNQRAFARSLTGVLLKACGLSAEEIVVAE